MLIVDVPSMPVQETPIVLAQSSQRNPQVDYILTQCQQTESTGDPRSAMRSVDPAGMLRNYLEFRDKKSNRLIDIALIKTTLIEGTRHGSITTQLGSDRINFYRYDAIPNYEGRDRAIFMAEFEGQIYKINVELRVAKWVDENRRVCPRPELTKIRKR